MNSIQLLAYLVRTLPLPWVLDAPLGQVRANTRHAIDLLNGPVGRTALAADPTLRTVVEPLLAIEKTGARGSTISPYREQVITAVGGAAVELAARVLAEEVAA